MRSMVRMLVASAAAVLVASGAAARAAGYPERPIRMIVPFPPGGSNDIVGRVIGQQLGDRLGKPVVIDNRGGAGGLIGTETAIHAQPDGHTLLIISVAYAYNPSLYKISYDPVKAIAPVAQLGTGPNSLVIHITNHYAKPPSRKWEQKPHPRGLMVRI